MFSIGKFQFNLNRWLKNWESFWPNEQFSNIYIYISLKSLGKEYWLLLFITSLFWDPDYQGWKIEWTKSECMQSSNSTDSILNSCSFFFSFTFCIRFIFVILSSFDLNLQNICIIYRSFDNQKYFNFYKVNNVESMWCEAIYIYIYKK